MQSQKIFTVHDAKAACYLPPFILPTTALAIRAISECANNKDHNFGKYPADYTLFELGTFDDNKAEIEVYDAPRLLGVCLEFVDADPIPQIKAVS